MNSFSTSRRPGTVSGQEWSRSRLKYLVRFVGGATPYTDEPDFWGGDIPWVSPKDMKTPNISDAEDHLSELGLASCSSQRVPAGNVLVVVRSGILRHTLPVAMNTRDVALNQDMKALIPRERLIARFLRFVLMANQPASLDLIRKQGATVESIDQTLLANVVVAFPDNERQIAIADFLDRETAEADALVAKYERLIELLEEKRVTLISQAVTKGLDPRAPMKDSGIAWAGENPAHWITPTFGYVAEIVLGKMRAAEPSGPGDVLVPYLKARNVTTEKLDFETSDFMWCSEAELIDLSVRAGDIIVCEGGVTFGRSAIASRDWPNKIIFEKSLHRIRTSQIVDAAFLHYTLVALRNSGFLSRIAATATFMHLTREKLVAMRFPMPPIKEQRDIIDFIERENAAQRIVISKVRSAVALVKEHRSALITAAVTGKIDVANYRSAAPQTAIGALA